MFRCLRLPTQKLLLGLVSLSISQAVFADCPNPTYDADSGILTIPCVEVLDENRHIRLLGVELLQMKSSEYRFDLNLETVRLVDNDDGATQHTVEGYAADGLLIGASVDATYRQNRMAWAITDVNGQFTVTVPTTPPYRLRVRGGTVDGIPYQGVLEAWCETTACHATPWTTIVVRLMDEYGFGATEARTLLNEAAGFDYDPFLFEQLTGQPVPAQAFELDRVRTTLNFGAGLNAWVADYASWLGGNNCQLSANLGLPATPACGGAPPMEDAMAPSEPVSSEVCEEKRISTIEESVLRYLSRSPNAAETIEGIMKWWLFPQTYANSPICVTQALDRLESNGCLVQVFIGGKTFYRGTNSC